MVLDPIDGQSHIMPSSEQSDQNSCVFFGCLTSICRHQRVRVDISQSGKNKQRGEQKQRQG